MTLKCIFLEFWKSPIGLPKGIFIEFSKAPTVEMLSAKSPKGTYMPNERIYKGDFLNKKISKGPKMFLSLHKEP